MGMREGQRRKGKHGIGIHWVWIGASGGGFFRDLVSYAAASDHTIFVSLSGGVVIVM